MTVSSFFVVFVEAGVDDAVVVAAVEVEIGEILFRGNFGVSVLRGARVELGPTRSFGEKNG